MWDSVGLVVFLLLLFLVFDPEGTAETLGKAARAFVDAFNKRKD